MGITERAFSLAEPPPLMAEMPVPYEKKASEPNDYSLLTIHCCLLQLKNSMNAL